MPTSNQESRVFAAVSSRTPLAKNLKVISVQNRFLDGSLYTVGFDIQNSEGEEISHINRVYVHGKAVDVYGFDEQLLAIVGATHGRGLVEYIKSPQLVTSIIAIAITILICAQQAMAIFYARPLEIPEFLSSGFLLILGFYFGKTMRSED